MKKNNLSSKAKKSIVVVGTAVICVGAAAAILSLNTGAKAPDIKTVSSSSATSSTISVGEINIESSASSEDKAFVPSSGARKTTQLTKIEKPTSVPPKPVIAGDAVKTSDGKVTPPTNPALTNKKVKPTYKTPPTVTNRSTGNTSTNNNTSKDTNTNNDTTNKTPGKQPSNGGGQADPVFGNQWGKGGQTIEDKGNWGGGSQVGIMD